MKFSGRFNLYSLAVVLALAGGGCTPSEHSQSDDEKEPHFVLGTSRYNARDFQGAVEAYREALEVNPRSASAHARLAGIFDNPKETEMADPAAAIYHHQEYLRLDPKAENADVIRQRIIGCKQQLAADVMPLPSASGAQKQLEELAEKNRRLQAEVDRLNTELLRWQNNVRLTQPDNRGTVPIVTPLSGGGTTTPPVVPRGRTVTVASGDTLAGIARKSGVSLAKLQAANPGVDAKKLRIGQTLNLPAQ